ncbi:unnamed protein product [Adineta ricciae]|uniref:Protein translocase subunit SecA n=1 Tax=Adineta ricciae TaxID=249248 RepID=A0A813SHC4_ADIRI|nr:unnamed protein product [Adineta ricciae]CAF1398742.1 unnamed protein product [Adineta ricciae]
MENNKNIFFDQIDEIILSSLTHRLASLADPDTSQQIICAVKNGEELQHNLLCQIQSLAENNDDVEGSIYAKHILCAHATWHSSFVEPTYFADLSELLKSADSTMRQCILWAFASTIPCTTILIPKIIECLYEYLHDSALQWVVLFIFRKLSENDEYVKLAPDDRWVSIISLSNDLELKEQARITVIHTMLNIYRKRKQLADHIKLELEKLIISDSTAKKLLVVAIKTLYKIVVNGARVSSSTSDRLYELAANSDNSITECVQELLEFLDDERNVSKVVLHSLSSDVKRELVVTRNTLIARSQENVIAPLTDSVNFDHLLDTVVDFDSTSHIEIQPTRVETGDNQAWHRRTVSEINHLGSLAKQGSLKSQDFHYLSDKMDNGWRWLSITRRTTMQKLVANAFLDAANAGQTLPARAIDVMIDNLLSTEYELGLICAECLLIVARRNEPLQLRHIEKIERKLDECRNDPIDFSKAKIIELYALCVKNGHHLTLDLELIEDHLVKNEIPDKVSYLYFKAAAVGKRILSPKHMKILCDIAKLKDRSLVTRHNCLGALQYSIKNMPRKCSLKPELIDRLGEILQDANEDLRKSAAVTLCLIGNDENSRLPNLILEGLTVMLQCEDQKLVCNILSIYMKLVKAKERLSTNILDKLVNVLFRPDNDFVLRQQTIWILKYAIDNHQDLPSPVLNAIELCLDDSESHIRNTAGLAFIQYWHKKVKKSSNNDIKVDNLLIFFRNQFGLQVQILALQFLQYLMKNRYELSDALLEVIEYCLGDKESSIVTHALTILDLYMKRKPLLERTVLCLEHLLTTETEAIPQVVKLLKIVVVCQGYILSERTIAHLGCLLFGKGHLSNIAILLQLADRNQPLPSDIIDLLRQHYCADVLRYSNVSISKGKAANELLTMTSNGQHVTGSVVETLFNLLKSSQLRSSLLTIFVNIIDNGQRFEHHRIDFFYRILLSSEEESLINLMKIFAQLSRQNYLISEKIVRYLAKFLDKPQVSVYVVEIYQHLIEHHKLVDRHIAQKILRFSNSNVLLAAEQNLQHRLIICSKTIAHRWPEEINQADLPSLLDLYSSSPTISQDIYSIIEALLRNGLILIPDVVEKLKHLLNNCDNVDILSTVAKILACAQSNKQVVHIEEDESFVQDLNKFSHALYTDDVNLKIEAANTISQRRLLPTQILSAIFTTLRDEAINAITIPLLFQASVTLPSSVIDDLLYVMISSKHSIVRETTRKLLRGYVEHAKVQLFFAYEQDWNQKKSVATMLQSSNQADVSRALQIFQGMLALDQRIPREVFLASAWLLSIHKDLTSEILIQALKRDIEMDGDVYEAIQDVFLVYQSKQMFILIQILTQKKIVLQLETLEILRYQIMISESVSALEGAARNQLLPKEILSCLISQLSKESSLRILSVLRYQMLQGAVDDLLEYITKLRLPAIVDDEKLSQLQAFDQYLGTLHTLLFINYFDSTVFDLPPEQWSRECLCVELLTGCANNEPAEIVGFYHHLTLLEQYKAYDLYDDERDLILQELIRKQRTYSLSLSHINQILICLQTLTDHSLDILRSDATNWFINLRRFFILDKLDECLCNAIYSGVAINHLADRIAKQDVISADVIEIFLRSVRQPEHIITYLDIIEKHQITNTELIQLFSNVSNTKDFISLVHEIELTVVNRLLIRQWHGPQAQLISARGYLHRLLELGWMLDKLIGMLSYVRTDADSCQSLAHFVDSLKTICQYKMKDNIVGKLNQIYSKEEAQLWPLSVHICVIEYRFGLTNPEKPISTLLEEIQILNRIPFRTSFIEILNRMNQALKSSSLISKQKIPIKDWNVSHIKSWASSISQQQNKDNAKRDYLPEILAVLHRAIYLHSTFEVRDVQILAILIILDRNHDSGRLLQVLTGEGKSTIVSILTVIQAIQGKRVDIVTSSITLAKRDVNQWKSFYDMFNLTAAHNNDETNYVEGFKCCYKENIVYGTASQFQFDILRDEFSLLKTRADRPFDLVIIDEVDSMLIDETNATARLAEHLPGMEWLNPLLYTIWQIINKCSDPISNRDQILKTARHFIYNSQTQLKYPTHLSDFVSSSLPLWVDHGIQAKVEYRLDYQYIIKKDEMGTLRIMPIDYSNTGVIQCHTTWSDGLHQFLQIKHGLKMTPLTVTTNYMSNYDLFTRYKNEIYGFSGTLGSPDAQTLLSKIYQVDNIVIPPCKPKRHYQLEAVLPSTDEDWLNTIVQNTIDHVNKRRAVLVICETRIDAKTIFKELQRQQPTSSIRLYTDNTDRIESNVVSNRVDCGDIIVATNLAGRGTDLKTTYDVEKHGGLHISLTFLPKNVRVEEQALGRTSRQGNFGTSQLILNRQRTFLQLMSWYPDYWNAHRHEFSDLTDIGIETIYDWRTQSESEQLDQIWKRDICELKEKSRLFRAFCVYLTELKETKEYTCCLSSVKEQWGLWLKSVDQREQARRMLERTIKEAGFYCIDQSLGYQSLFDVICYQLRDQMSADTIKKKITEHISNNNNIYKGNEETQRYWAITRALNTSILMFRSDFVNPFLYKAENTTSTCYIGYVVSQVYLVLEPLSPHTYYNFDEFEQTPPPDSDTMQSDLSCEELASVIKLKDSIWAKVDKQNLNDSFEEFKKQTRKEHEANQAIRNPYYLIFEADHLITKYCSLIHRIKTIPNFVPFINCRDHIIVQAVNLLKRAVELDSAFAFTALINLAYFTIVQHKPSETYKLTAKSFLMEAQKQIEQHIVPSLVFMKALPCNENDDIMHEDFSRQMEAKLMVISSYSTSIEQAISNIENSQKLIDFSSKCNQTIKTAEKLYRKKPTEFICENCREIKLTFHSLTVVEDVIKTDQALELLKLIPSDYSHVSIEYSDMDKTKLEALSSNIPSCREYQNNLLDPNLESKQMTLITSINIESNAQLSDSSIVSTRSYVDTTVEMVERLPDDQSSSCYFENLSPEKARHLLQKNTDRNFVLHFHQLTHTQALKILDKFDRNEQNINASFKSVTEYHFQNNRLTEEELHEYAGMGISRFLLVEELQPRPIIASAIVVTFGGIQVVSGACLIALTNGIGVTLGTSLIGEGISDIFFGIQSVWSRHLSLKQYSIQKGLSLLLSFSSLGFSTVNQAVSIARTNADFGSHFFGQTMKETVNIFKSSFTAIGTTAAPAATGLSLTLGRKQLMTLGKLVVKRPIANLLSKASDSLKPFIQAKMIELVNEQLDNIAFVSTLNKALIADMYYETDRYQKEIENIINDLLKKQANICAKKRVLVNALRKIAPKLVSAAVKLSGILSQTHNVSDEILLRAIGVYSSALCEFGKAYQFNVEMQNLFATFFEQCTTLKIPTFKELLHHRSGCLISESTATEIYEELLKHKFVHSDYGTDALYDRQNSDSDFSGQTSSCARSMFQTFANHWTEFFKKFEHIDEDQKQHVLHVVRIFSKANHSLLKKKFRQKVVDLFVEHIVTDLYDEIIQPLIKQIVKRATDFLADQLDDECDTKDKSIKYRKTPKNKTNHRDSFHNDLIEKFHDLIGNDNLVNLLGILAALKNQPISIVQKQIENGSIQNIESKCEAFVLTNPRYMEGIISIIYYNYACRKVTARENLSSTDHFYFPYEKYDAFQRNMKDLVQQNTHQSIILSHWLTSNSLHFDIETTTFILLYPQMKFLERTGFKLNSIRLCKRVPSDADQEVVCFVYCSYEGVDRTERLEEYANNMLSILNPNDNIREDIVADSPIVIVNMCLDKYFHYMLMKKEIIITDAYDEIETLLFASTSKNIHLQTIPATATSSILGNILFKMCQLLNSDT